jgi:hypoxanthine phosphoribosyltransferase
METVDPHQYRLDADCLFNEDAVASAIFAMSSALNSDYKNECPIVLSVMTGAIFFAGRLMSHLTFPLELDYVHATRYQSGIEGKDIEWIAKPKLELENRNVLILDDILDVGITLNTIVNACYALGAKQVKTAVLVEKELNRKKSITADYVGLKVPDRYVFGCGMDVYGWWRNLPAIYALKNT